MWLHNIHSLLHACLYTQCGLSLGGTIDKQMWTQVCYRKSLFQLGQHYTMTTHATVAYSGHMFRTPLHHDNTHATVHIQDTTEV